MSFKKLQKIRFHLNIKKLYIFSVFAIIVSFSVSALAKDMTHRLGIGVSQSSYGIAQLTVNYYPSYQYTWVGHLAIDTIDTNSYFIIGGELRRHLFFEDQLNFFIAAKMDAISSKVNQIQESGFSVATLFGAEYFLTGLDNLGLQLEAGLEMSSLGGSRFKTVGGNLLQAGMIFYF